MELGAPFRIRYHDKNLGVIRKMNGIGQLDLAVFDRSFICRGFHICHFTLGEDLKSKRPLPKVEVERGSSYK